MKGRASMMDKRDNYVYFCPHCFREGTADLAIHDILNGWRCPYCRNQARIFQFRRTASGEGYERIEIPT